jgi:hypothetical protein
MLLLSPCLFLLILPCSGTPFSFLSFDLTVPSFPPTTTTTCPASFRYGVTFRAISLSLSLSIYRATLGGLHALECGHVTCVHPHTPLTVWVRRRIYLHVSVYYVCSPPPMRHCHTLNSPLTPRTCTLTCNTYIDACMRACVRLCVCVM